MYALRILRGVQKCFSVPQHLSAQRNLLVSKPLTTQLIRFQPSFRPILPVHKNVVGNRTLAGVPITPSRKPTLKMAHEMPRGCEEMSNEVLMVFVAQGAHDAIRERLTRNIMTVDNCNWDAADQTVDKISRENQKHTRLLVLPYWAGLITALSSAAVSFPLCFHLDSVLWFNKTFVTSDIPEDKDLESWLEVGSWAWSFMEPPLGQISFVLLCLAFARNQMLNLKISPYTDIAKGYRAKKLVKAFPRYHNELVEDFSKSDDWK